MKFANAFREMRSGNKVKLPSWGGYWYWDAEKKTIVIHTKDGEELDIRQTECPEYTFDNIASDEWQICWLKTGYLQNQNNSKVCCQ